MAQDLQRSDAPLYRLDAIDFGRRMAVEKEFEKTESAPQPNAVFDESSNFLIYATLLGIKVRYTCYVIRNTTPVLIHFALPRKIYHFLTITLSLSLSHLFLLY